LLSKLSGTTVEHSCREGGHVALEKIEATTLPVVPLLYGADWDEYSTANFTGFVRRATVHGPVAERP